MASNIKSLAKQTLVYGVGTVLSRFVTFLLLPLYTNVMTRSEYGLASLVFAFLGFMNIIYNYGLDSAVMRFYSEGSNDSRKNTILSTAIWMCLATSFIFSLIIYNLDEFLGIKLLSSSENALLIRYGSFILFFDCICHVPFALLRLEEKPFQFMGLRLFNVLITFSLNIYFVACLRMGVVGIFRSNLIASAVTSAILYFIIFRKVKFIFSGSKAKDLLLFGLPFIPAGLATVSMEMINRYIIRHFMGLEAVGIFSAGFKLGVFMQLVTTAFYYAWQPFFLKAGKNESSRPLFAQVLTYFVLVELSFWILLTIFLHEIVRFHIGDIYLIGIEFQACKPIVPIILLGYIFLGMNNIFLPGIYFDKKTRYIAYMTIISAVVNIAANFLLIPSLGIIGSALASLLGYIVLAFCTFAISQKLFNVPYEYKKVVLLFFIALVIGVPIYILQPNIFVKISAVIVYPILLKVFGIFGREEVNKIKAIILFKKEK
jgi:O-antigen/teichoic acid export membrane protein